MKKLSALFVVFLLAFAANSFDAKAIGISIKIEFGKHTPEGNCGPGRGICSITIGGSLRTNPGNPTGGTDVEVLEGTAELKDGKLYITASKGINEKGKNERGAFEFAIKEQGVKSSLIIDPSVLKELGVQSLKVAPGNYTFKGNSIVFNTVKGPRDAASGQASGKR